MKLLSQPCYFEAYKNFRDYGDGCMLCYWTGANLEYVQFTPHGSPKKVIISKELLEKYKKEMTTDV